MLSIVFIYNTFAKMGIRYLQTFVCKDVPNGFFQVEIGQEINKWKKKNDGTPLIVFDVMGILSITLQSKLTDLLLGGKHHILLNKYQEFFLKLKHHGAELVFFCDGRVQQNKADVWIERQNEKYRKTIEIFDKIEETNGCLDFINVMRKEDFPGLTTLSFGLVNVCRKHGELMISMNAECDTELSRFATMNNVVAVVADDTDFLIYEGDWKYWSARNLNFDKLTTMEYSRSALRTTLGLAPKQLPILATLAGNDIVRYEHVQAFHKRLRLTSRNHFRLLAQYIRSNSNNIQDVSVITFAIFKSIDIDLRNRVQESLNSYNIHYDTREETDLLIAKSRFDTCFYTFLNGWPFNVTMQCFDMRRVDFLPYYDIAMPIVKRQVGFVRQHKNDPDYMQVITTKVDHNQSFKELTILPDYPNVKLPDLLDITFDQKNESLNPLRFDILNWMIFGCFETLKIQQIPMEYMVLVSTLKYLLKLHQLTTQEADALLLCVNAVHQKKIPNEIVTGNVATRTIMVAQLYAKMHNVILTCFKFVGLEKFIDFLVFDGPYFAVLLKFLMLQTESNYDNAVIEIQQYRNFLYC